MIIGPPAVIGIGASAGAVDALSRILPMLPADFPLAVLVVVHVPPDRRNMLAPLFQAKCRMIVREADDKDPITAGTIVFAPPDYHLLVEAGHTLALSNDEPVLHSRPSIDVLFESLADAYGADAIGVILTGANADGAQGLRAIAEAGGLALVEAPGDAQADAMPLAAIAACPQALVLPLSAIAERLMERAR